MYFEPHFIEYYVKLWYNAPVRNITFVPSKLLKGGYYVNSASDIVVTIPEEAFTYEILSELLKKGKNPPDAISWAAENGYPDLVEALIKNGADIRENYNYPLELASRNGHTRIVKMLIDAGAKTSDNKDEGYCLRMAAWYGHKEIAKILIESGANPQADNYRALQFALNKNNMSIAEMLLDEICKCRLSKRKPSKKMTVPLFAKFANKMNISKYIIINDDNLYYTSGSRSISSRRGKKYNSTTKETTGLRRIFEGKWAVFDVDENGEECNIEIFPTREKAFDEIVRRFNCIAEYVRFKHDNNIY